MLLDTFQNANSQFNGPSTVLAGDRNFRVILDSVEKCGQFGAQRLDVAYFQPIDRDAQQRMCGLRI